jgi:hypothetical protein
LDSSFSIFHVLTYSISQVLSVWNLQKNAKLPLGTVHSHSTSTIFPISIFSSLIFLFFPYFFFYYLPSIYFFNLPVVVNFKFLKKCEVTVGYRSFPFHLHYCFLSVFFLFSPSFSFLDSPSTTFHVLTYSISLLLLVWNVQKNAKLPLGTVHSHSTFTIVSSLFFFFSHLPFLSWTLLSLPSMFLLIQSHCCYQFEISKKTRSSHWVPFITIPPLLFFLSLFLLPSPFFSFLDSPFTIFYLHTYSILQLLSILNLY